MHIPLPENINWILSIFAQHNVEVFLVGGCVRDFLLHRPIHDFDMTTKATPEEMIAMFKNESCKVLPLGIQHGTITIIKEQDIVEITTYRSDGVYDQHRRPTSVQFTNSLYEDLARRDFTINAIAWNPEAGIQDPFNGQADLNRQLLRCVGNSMLRFEEDALRILRALRFSLSLGFEIEKNCLEAIQTQAHLLSYISKERIREEFNKMLDSNAFDILVTLRACGVLPYIIPELELIYSIPQESKWHCYDVFIHTDIALNHSQDFALAEKLAIVLHDIGKAETKTFDKLGFAHFKGHPIVSANYAKLILKRLAYPKKLIENVMTLISYHDYYVLPQKHILRRFLAHINMDYAMAYAILRVQYCDDCAKNIDIAQSKLDNLKQCVALLECMERESDRLLLSDLCVNGNDMKAFGLKGKEIGQMLKHLYRIVIHDPSLNQKDQLLTLTQEYINEKEKSD